MSCSVDQGTGVNEPINARPTRLVGRKSGFAHMDRADAFFPLTPALSPWERENSEAALGIADNVRTADGGRLQTAEEEAHHGAGRLRLPWGEGRGEGDVSARFNQGSKTDLRQDVSSRCAVTVCAPTPVTTRPGRCDTNRRRRTCAFARNATAT